MIYSLCPSVSVRTETILESRVASLLIRTLKIFVLDFDALEMGVDYEMAGA